MKRPFSLVVFCFLLLSISYGQLSLQDGTSNYLIDFDATVSDVNSGIYTGLGFANSPSSGQLDADAWATTGMSDGAKDFSTSNTAGDHARGPNDGGVSTGGFYGFDIGSGNRAIGIQSAGSDWTPGTLTLKITNNSTSVINDVDINYTVYVLNDQDRSCSFNFSYSLNNTNYTDVTSSNYTSAQLRDQLGWVANNRNIQLTSLGLNPGANLYIRWSGNDVGGSGSRDEFALDDISIFAAGSTSNCTEPTAQATNLSFGIVSSNSIQATFTGSAADKHLAAISTSSSLGAAPSDGVLYTAGQSIGNGEVLQYSNSTSINALGLSSNTLYYIYVFSANDNCSGGPDYRSANPLTGFTTTQSNGQSNYYDGIGSETCSTLKTALHNLIDGHTSVSYASLWTHYQTTDDRLNDSGTETIVWDVYSDNPAGAENEFTFVSEQCGTYQAEGGCYNREHTFPKSWWGGATSNPQYTDIFLVMPADGWINGIRNNNPYGEVQSGTESHITNNGSKLGTSSISIPGYNGSVFEPIDAYKGDLARGYFYMAARYEDVIDGWENNTVESDAVMNGTADVVFEQWMIDMLLSWHSSDPVDQKEIDRNEAIFAIQGNRNPFIDHPEYAALIWSSCNGDTQAPTAPSLAASNTTEFSTDLSWSASTDNVGVNGYRIYQDGGLVMTLGNTTFATTINGLTESTSYVFEVTAFDAASNESVTSNAVSITTTTPSSSTVLHEGYFESGWDGWTDGGSDCAYYTGSNSAEGNASIRIRDNSGTSSSMTSPTFDISSYDAISIDFSFYPRSMETNEDFWLRYYDGSGWQTIATYVRGTDFNNGTFYTANVTIDNSTHTFPTDAQFRFQCDASGNNDQIYIDEVVITEVPAGTSRAAIVENDRAKQILDLDEDTDALASAAFVANPTFESNLDAVVVYPNPTSHYVNIDLDKINTTIIRMDIMNMMGSLIESEAILTTTGILQKDVSHLTSGIYLLHVLDDHLQQKTIKFYVN